MKQPAALFSLIAVMQTTAVLAGSITLTSGNVQTTGNQVITASGARAEATVDQRGSVVRLGSNTAAQVGDRGDVSLSKGVVLISSGDGFLRRRAVQVATPQGDVTVRGSAIVAALPDGSVKMTLLEGSARGTLGGQNMALNPGNLIVQRPEGTRDTVQVNLNSLTQSSALLDNTSFKQPLPAAPEIRQEVAQQAQVLGATLTLARNDSTATRSENKTVEIKSTGSGLLARIFHVGGSDSKADDNTNTTGPVLQIQGRNPSQTSTIAASQGGTNLLRVSGAVSGSNVLLGGTSAGTTMLGAGGTQTQFEQGTTRNMPSTHLVVANGSTQQLATQGTLTLANSTNLHSTASSLVKAGAGTLTLRGGVQNVQGINGTTTVTSPGGAVITIATPSVNMTSIGSSIGGGTLINGGIITTQNITVGGSTPPPASAP